MNLNQQEKEALSVYRNKSFTKAAAELGISQPALSASVNKLEGKIGIRIFDRGHMPVTPTPEGMVYLEYLKKSELDYRECLRKISDLMERKDFGLTVGTPVAYATSFLTEHILAFCMRYPECRISIRVASLPELMEMAADGEVDCFISTSNELGSDFITEQVAQESIVLCVPKIWEVNAGLSAFQINQSKDKQIKTDTMEWKLFDGMPMIMLEDGQPLKKLADEFVYREKLFVQKNIVVNQVLPGLEFVAEGLGMMLSSDTAVKGCKGIDRICIYPTPDYIATRPLYVAYCKHNYMPRKCEEFIRMLDSSC